MTTYSLYERPGTDARVAIATKGNLVSLAFLAKGSGRRSDGTYRRRNPGRRALVDHVTTLLRFRMSEGRVQSLAWVRGGKAAQKGRTLPHLGFALDPSCDPWTRRNATDALMAEYRRGGNYRFDAVLKMDRPVSVIEAASLLRLSFVSTLRAPKDVRWGHPNQAEPTPFPAGPLSYHEEQALLASAIAEFDGEFSLRSPGSGANRFRVCQMKSYASTAGSIQLVIQSLQTVPGSFTENGCLERTEWVDYSRCTPAELRAQIRTEGA